MNRGTMIQSWSRWPPQPVSLLLFFASFSILLVAGPAKADWPVTAVQCDGVHNRMLVRFGMNGGHYSEIPSALAVQWNQIPIAEGSFLAAHKCLFADGENVVISYSASQMVRTSGGGDIDVYFKMFVGRHLVYDDKQAYVGHGLSIYKISAVQYSPGKLLDCDPRETWPSMMKTSRGANPICSDESRRLRAGKQFLSAQELATAQEEAEHPEDFYLPPS